MSLKEIAEEYEKKLRDQWKVEPMVLSNNDQKCEVQFLYSLKKARNKYPNSLCNQRLWHWLFQRSPWWSTQEPKIRLVFPQLCACYSLMAVCAHNEASRPFCCQKPSNLAWNMSLQSWNMSLQSGGWKWSAVIALKKLLQLDELREDFNEAIKSVGSPEEESEDSDELNCLYQLLAGANVDKFKEEDNTQRNTARAVNNSLRTRKCLPKRKE